MKKTVYYVEGLAYNDSFCDEFKHTFSLDEAKESALIYYNRLTPNEIKERRISVVGYEVEEIGSPKESLDAFLEDAINFDPVFYEDYTDRIEELKAEVESMTLPHASKSTKKNSKKGTTLKKAIVELINSERGELRLNNVSMLRRWTKNALDMDVDELKLYFDNINNVSFSIFDTTIKSRDYDGIIKECCALTEKFFTEVNRSLCNDMKAGYRNRTF